MSLTIATALVDSVRRLGRGASQAGATILALRTILMQKWYQGTQGCTTWVWPARRRRPTPVFLRRRARRAADSSPSGAA
jgi:hypothetical protein